MANSIISTIVGTFIGGNGSFIAKNETTGSDALTELKVRDVSIDSQTMNTINPVVEQAFSESATLVSLTEADIKTIKIIQPSRLRVTAFANSTSGIDGVVSAFKNKKDTFSVTSKGITAKSLTITAVEIIQGSDMLSASKIVIDMEQVQLPEIPKAFDPAQSADASTAASYGVAITPLNSFTTNVATLYNKINNFIKG